MANEALKVLLYVGHPVVSINRCARLASASIIRALCQPLHQRFPSVVPYAPVDTRWPTQPPERRGTRDPGGQGTRTCTMSARMGLNGFLEGDKH